MSISDLQRRTPPEKRGMPFHRWMVQHGHSIDEKIFAEWRAQPAIEEAKRLARKGK